MASGNLIAMQNLRFVLVEGEAENEGDGLCHGNSAEKSHWTLAYILGLVGSIQHFNPRILLVEEHLEGTPNIWDEEPMGFHIFP